MRSNQLSYLAKTSLPKLERGYQTPQGFFVLQRYNKKSFSQAYLFSLLQATLR